MSRSSFACFLLIAVLSSQMLMWQDVARLILTLLWTQYRRAIDLDLVICSHHLLCVVLSCTYLHRYMRVVVALYLDWRLQHHVSYSLQRQAPRGPRSWATSSVLFEFCHVPDGAYFARQASNLSQLCPIFRFLIHHLVLRAPEHHFRSRVQPWRPLASTDTGCKMDRNGKDYSGLLNERIRYIFKGPFLPFYLKSLMRW